MPLCKVLLSLAKLWKRSKSCQNAVLQMKNFTSHDERDWESSVEATRVLSLP